ncbi:TPA: hypothetical protein DD449_00200 [Candidatus Berkelbacteria bacterium]|uniref:Uncharacterized protein n=1 Tax=Berkelbacteria bacterium GW2011_GWE1_39_12 TaxID=1618337 RepID=A0A0G4B4C7_9BACT|nr:MAG: hypothetical protein UT28_C0001G0028 [Berkelbacteria bacterium GW2011_GWE1_39_12]HBO60095.1 hypothetical protein [Candidatus Berkelbacteria bacterium]
MEGFLGQDNDDVMIQDVCDGSYHRVHFTAALKVVGKDRPLHEQFEEPIGHAIDRVIHSIDNYTRLMVTPFGIKVCSMCTWPSDGQKIRATIILTRAKKMSTKMWVRRGAMFSEYFQKESQPV